jgi:hypothetical protein
MTIRHAYRRLPEIPTGYAIDPPHVFGVVLPESTTNLVTNPSVERATTGYTASNGSAIARSSTRQRRGAYSLAITPSSHLNSGGYYSLSLTTGSTYTASLDIWGAPGVPYRIAIADNGGAIINRRTFRGKGRWVRLWVNAPITSTATYRIYAEKDGSASTAVFYIDGLLVEAKPYPTTYCDGDQVGYVGLIPAYQWTGTPHASTSTRHAQCRSGGRHVLLRDLGLVLTSIVGLGTTPAQNVITPAGGQGGGYYQRSVDGSRVLSLVGRLDAASGLHHQHLRGQFENALRMSTTYPRQPLVLTYQLQDEDGAPLGEQAELLCVYDGPGLGAQLDNLHGEAVELRFTAMRPALLQDGWSAKALTLYTTVDDSQGNTRLMQRLASGTYAAVGAGIANGEIIKIRYNPVNGLFYIVGSFTNGIKSYDPATDTLADLGTGLNGTARDVDFDTAGNVITVGGFTTAGGSSANRIAKWTIATSAWSTFGTGLDAAARGVAVVKRGTTYLDYIFVTGDFANANGVARLRAAYIDNGGNWGTMGSGLNNIGYAITISQDGLYAYYGGAFTAAGGVASTDYFARWYLVTGAWQASGSAGTIGDEVRALCTHPSGDIYLGGEFARANSVADLLARYTGTTIVGVGAGLDSGATAMVRDLQCDAITGDVYAAGDILYIGPSTGSFITSLQTSSPLIRVSGNTLSFLDTGLSTSGGEEGATICIGPDRRILMAPVLAGITAQMYGAGVVTINRAGSADAYPVVELVGPGRFYQLRNATTGKEISFGNLVLMAGERALLSLEPDNRFFSSSARGDISQHLMPGSQDDSFFLLGRNGQNSGENVITLYADPDTVTSDSGATMRWREAYESLAATADGVTS